jgi:hypothetical protein
MKVTDVSATGLVLTVLRNAEWSVLTASESTDDTMAVIGNSNSEGSGSPESQSFDPTGYYNYTQIVKEAFDLTGTAMKTSVKYDPSGPWPEKMREALNLYSIQMEKAVIFGKRRQYTNATTGRIERTMGGIVSYIPAANLITTGTTLTYALLNTHMEAVFRTCLNNSQEKLMLCGSGFMSILNQVFKANATINLVPKAETFGLKMWEYVSPHGTLYIKTHPLFSQISEWRNNALIVDLPGLRYRYLTGRDTKRQQNIQLPDADLRKDQFISESTIEVHHGAAHMYITGYSAAGT